MRLPVDHQTIIQYLRRWQVAPADALAAQVEACGGAWLPDEVQLALAAEKGNMPVSPALAENREMVRTLMGYSSDLLERSLYLGANRVPAALFCVDGLAERMQVMTILESLAVQSHREAVPTDSVDGCLTTLQQMIPSVTLRSVTSLGQALEALVTGDTILFVDGMPFALVLPTDGPPGRQPDEPLTEPVVRGPKDGFTETLSDNLALIRRRIRDDRLRIERFTLGERSKTRVVITYLMGIAPPEMVQEVRNRIGRIQADAVLESGHVEELIEDDPFTIFPLLKVTERPDVATAGMLEGKVAVLVDGSPNVLLMPSTLVAEMQSPEDYYHRWPISSFVRALRYLYLLIAFLGPSIYVAITTFHQELIPTNLLTNLIAAREGVPFPAVMEALMMELTMEALREAGVRLPKVVGQAVSIVGALVIGESAVHAGLVSPVMVIVVALTAISSFIIPLYAMALAVRLLRFFLIVLAGTFGFFGIAVGLMALFVHLNTLRSFGVPYLSPIVPPTLADQRDVFIRVPWWAIRRRPRFMPAVDYPRSGPDNRPRPPQPQGGQAR
ncbi:spore germination protein [Symbiobacterium thermophilum]|uniref:spore germination protein n=1 Tax=Symbiobacterium thermophilum TaxID=2734 RepID=UPI002354E21E|nr:spore germination protein [Symbiobacterium thermophilum]